MVLQVNTATAKRSWVIGSWLQPFLLHRQYINKLTMICVVEISILNWGPAISL